MAAKKATKAAFRTAKKAQEAIRKGELDGGAIEALAAFADGGDISAAHSLAELHAYREEWNDLFSRLAQFFPRSNAMRSGNVTADAVCLLWLAAQRTNRWDEAERTVDTIPEAVLSDGWYGRLARELRALAKANGAGEALVFVPAKTDSVNKRVADWMTTTENARAEGNFDRIFRSAVNYQLVDQALEAYPRVKKDIAFDDAVFVAAALARRGSAEAAWVVLERNIPMSYWRVDSAQVAPVRLVYDPAIRPLMTNQRRAWVLTTPRQG
jgi:hypothetical protein